MCTLPRPRGRNPEGMDESEGARAPKRCVLICLGSLSAPARGISSAEGAVTSRASHTVPPGHRRRALLRSGTAGGCACVVRVRAPLREGLPCALLPASPGLDRLARDLRRAGLAAAARTGARQPHLGTAPCPASDAQACRVPRVGRDGRRIRSAREAGISFVLGCNTSSVGTPSP